MEQTVKAGDAKQLKGWSGRPGSNRRRPAWEAGILPLNYSRFLSIPLLTSFCRAYTSKELSISSILSAESPCSEDFLDSKSDSTSLRIPPREHSTVLEQSSRTTA